MKLNCPLCHRDFIFPLKLVQTLSQAETWKRNPQVEILCQNCGQVRARVLSPRRKKP